MRILVTGGAGFIGSALVRRLIAMTDHDVFVLDDLSFSTLDSLASVIDHPRCHILGHVEKSREPNSIDDPLLHLFMKNERIDAVMHLAAETHVDRSINDPRRFLFTNVVGTHNMLEAALSTFKEYRDGRGLMPKDPERAARFRFHHISTDEVYGSLEPGDEPFTEKTRYDPRSPYAASKASSDHFVRAFHHTYGLPVLVTNCSNNYGPFQFPEKLIPLMIIKALKGEALPVYGQGDNIRDWLYVDDHADALISVIEEGKVGQTYNIGGNNEVRNIDVVTTICRHLDKLAPKTGGGKYEEQITFVTDRPGHDYRYAMDTWWIRDQLGWEPAHSFSQGLRETVVWYLENKAWWEKIMRERGYDGQRLGTIEKE